MRQALDFEVSQRRGTWNDVRKHLLRAFEALGGLTVATSMVENNTHRLLDVDEFRGFSLVDPLAPLVFVNTRQTLNGQIFTLGHEFAHIWLGRSGISLEDPKWEPQGEVETWCNAVASEFLVPRDDLQQQYPEVRELPLAEQLDGLATRYRCGTLVVLQALRRHQLQRFEDFDATYDAEVARLQELSKDKSGGGGNHYDNQPFRIGERFSRAIVSDALSGRTPLSEAIRLTSLNSLSSFDTYAERLGVA
jgi:Zn-dependent peptidase ImmA (M78 family)